VQGPPLTRARSRRAELGFALLSAVRPRQWLKNLLVAAVPLAAGRGAELPIIRSVGLTIGVWCLAASAVYLFNDVFDRDLDRANPARAHRPIASGALPLPIALTVGMALTLVAIVSAWSLVNPASALLVLGYTALQLLYSAFLKNEPIFELGIVASGFVVRTIAGGLATGLELSPWFLLVATFGALFMVSGKRYSEFRAHREDQPFSRPVLAAYSASFLRFTWTVSSGIAILTYALWAIEGHSSARPWWIALSILPLTLGVLRYAMRIDTGRAGDPEDVIVEDRVLLLLGVAFIVLVAVGVTDGG